VPLACGGPDAPSNMQWQTTREAKAKDKWENKGLRSVGVKYRRAAPLPGHRSLRVLGSGTEEPPRASGGTAAPQPSAIAAARPGRPLIDAGLASENPTSARHAWDASSCHASRRVGVIMRRIPIALGTVIDSFAASTSSF
jgi:hypothetical protein